MNKGWSAFFGEAAFGWSQSELALVVLCVTLSLVLWAIVSRRNLPLEAAFLVAIGGALLSNIWGMIIITVGSLTGAVVIGEIVSRLGGRH